MMELEIWESSDSGDQVLNISHQSSGDQVLNISHQTSGVEQTDDNNKCRERERAVVRGLRCRQLE